MIKSLIIILQTILSSACDVLYIYDITGSYDANSNPDGWTNTGYSNSKDQVVSAKLTFTVDSSSDEYEVDIDDFSGLGDYSNSAIFSGGFPVNVANVLGSSYDQFPDGWWTITLEVTFDDGNTEQSIIAEGITCSLLCCMKKKGSDLSFPICDYDKVKEYNHARTLYSRMIDALCCGHEDRYLKIKAYLEDWCEGCNTANIKNFSSTGQTPCS